MEKFIFTALLISMTAFANQSAGSAHGGGGTVGSDRDFVIDGIRAEDLIEAAGRLNLDDYSMGGKQDLDLHNIVCKKVMPAQNGDEGKIECLIGSSSTVSTPDNTNILLTTNKEDQKNAVVRLRTILSELTGAEVQVNSKEIQMKIKSVSCHAINHQFDLDGLLVDGGGTCEISL